MTDRPIIFSGPMVRALLDGRKTQTRRVLKPQPKYGFEPWQDEDIGDWWQSGHGEAGDDILAVPYAIGDRLWVRETFREIEGDALRATYAADTQSWVKYGGGGPWRPSIHMPRWASRLTLTVTDVRVQRLQDITPANAIAEGIRPAANSQTIDCDTPNPVDEFAHLWNTIHGPDAWDRNDWVAALTFTVEQRNIDAQDPKVP